MARATAAARRATKSAGCTRASRHASTATLIERDSSCVQHRIAPLPRTRRPQLALRLGARCADGGVSSVVGARRSGWSAASGSLSNASTMATAQLAAVERLHERRLLDDAAARHVHRDRATLETRELAAAIMPSVSSVSAVCTCDLSASRALPRAWRAAVFSARNRSSPTYGSKPATSIPKASARVAISPPMRPTPTITRVFPLTPCRAAASDPTCVAHGVGGHGGGAAAR